MYTYRNIFAQALRTAWYHPVLWFFGFFVALVTSAGEMEILLGGYGSDAGAGFLAFWQGFFSSGLLTTAGLTGLLATLTGDPLSFFVSTIVFLIVIALLFGVLWLIVVSLTALIAQVIAIGKRKPLLFRESFIYGIYKFWPVLGVSLLVRVSTWALFSLAALLGLLVFPGSIFIFILGFDVLLIAMFGISFLSRYAICGIVLKNWSFQKSITAAWQLFRRHWILTLELSIILFFIYVVVNIVLLFTLGVALLYALKLFADFIFGLYLSLLVLFALFLLVEILLAIFHWATWAIVFELLMSKQALVKSFLKRTIGEIFG